MLQPTYVKVTYKTGACFEGSVQDYKKTGNGLFVWPNGSKYEGDYVYNMRHGEGVQTWADGSRYEGKFVNDLRHGHGSIQWANGETYEGEFVKDRRHGNGTYTWPDNSSFTGTFYMDKKEGYGVFTLASGNVFEGLYKDDEREGPGVVKYHNGRQDVGIWRGEQLVKILTPVEGAFTMKEHEEFVYEEEDMRVPVVMPADNLTVLKKSLQHPSIFDYAPELDASELVSDLYSEDLDPRSLAVNRQAFDKEFFREWDSPKDSESGEIISWNKTPTLIDIQMHIHKHRRAAPTARFKVDKVLQFSRTGFKSAGPLEQASEELIKMAAAGNTKRVEELLNSGKVHPDVADKNGYTALIGATVNWHQDTINVLLNHGANVNQLSDEGISALTAGMVFYYPVDSFTYNIAERYLVKPPSPESPESRASVRSKSSQGSGGGTERRTASQLNQANRRKSQQQCAGDSGSVKGEDSGTKKDRSQVKIVLSQDTLEEKASQGDQKIHVKDSDKDSVLDGGEMAEEEAAEEAAAEREEFESNVSMRNYQIEVTDNLVERCATQLSQNERVVSREASQISLGKARQLAIQISHHERMKETLELLLRRGANPNASHIPMPVLFFAIKAADVEMVRQLLLKGASANAALGKDKGCLAPLHIAAALPVDEGVAITELLLNALAHPDARAMEDDSFLNRTLMDEWAKDPISEASADLLGGRTPLQLACARDDNYKNATKVVTRLLQHKANPNLLCNGFSPLALAIASGNDLAVDELLMNGADPSLLLTHGVGSALCVASSTEYEHRRTIQGRMNLINKLITFKADILAPILIGPKRQVGTAVDYAYYMFNQEYMRLFQEPVKFVSSVTSAALAMDKRIAHMPYHALSYTERDTYNNRKRLLSHLGDILRGKAIEREKWRREDEERQGQRSASPSQAFVYTGAGDLPPLKGKSAVWFQAGAKEGKGDQPGEPEPEPAGAAVTSRKPLFKYCYECGRSVGVRLAACTRCKEVFYCSKACKMKAWNQRHKDECLRVPGKTKSPSPPRGDSPATSSNVKDKDGKKNLKINELPNSSSVTGKEKATRFVLPRINLAEKEMPKQELPKQELPKQELPKQELAQKNKPRTSLTRKRNVAQAPSKGLSRSARQGGRDDKKGPREVSPQAAKVLAMLEQRRTKSAKMFETEDFRMVYLDNYSYN